MRTKERKRFWIEGPLKLGRDILGSGQGRGGETGGGEKGEGYGGVLTLRISLVM